MRKTINTSKSNRQAKQITAKTASGGVHRDRKKYGMRGRGEGNQPASQQQKKGVPLKKQETPTNLRGHANKNRNTTVF